MLRLAWTTVVIVLVSGCESSPPSGAHLPQPAPTTSLPGLSPAARASLEGTIDVDALDRLLNTLGPEDRARYLMTFADAEQGASGLTEGETRDVSIITFMDPERQHLSEHVWAPLYRHLPPEVLHDVSYPFPGRRLAAARRSADSLKAGDKEPEP